MSAPTPTFTGEVQFRRWSDSSTQGVQVTFALHDSEALEPLKHKAGKRFMAVLVEIGDDEQPVSPAPRKDTRGPLCREACDYCKSRDFRQWIAADDSDSVTETGAREFILNVCGVLSRKELDEQLTAGGRFVREIRVPFLRWLRENRRAA